MEVKDVHERTARLAVGSRKERIEALEQSHTFPTASVVAAATLVNIEKILEAQASAPVADDALLEEASTVIAELVTIFQYKPELGKQFGGRERQARRLLSKIQGRLRR